MSGASDATEVLAAAAAASGDIAYVWDLRADTIAWAGAVAALFGAPAGDASGENLRARVADADRRGRRRALAAGRSARGGRYDCTYRLRLADGDLHWVQDRGAVERDADGRARRACGMLRVVGAGGSLPASPAGDPMAGLSNRSGLGGGLAAALAVGPAAYLAIGVDALSLLNDALGHAVADAVVAETVRRIRASLPEDALVGRTGGDLFGAVLPGCGDGAVAAEGVLAAVRAAPVDTASGPIHVTVSIGGATGGATGGAPARDESRAVMTNAEAAMAEAKRQGRDRYWPHDGESPGRRALLACVATGQRVRTALGDGSLRLAYQPVADEAGAVVYHECLARIAAGDALVPAGDFMPAVERLSIARRVDHHTLGLVLGDLRTEPTATLAMNLSAGTTADGTWLTALGAGLAGRPDVARRLIVEITETAAIADLDETARFVAAVRRLGCRVALDDFGAGYLSHRHARALPVDIVKIDASFAVDLGADLGACPDALLFIRSVVGMARTNGQTTVAEGVEHAGQAATLFREGVDLIQGFHVGRPVPAPPWSGAASQRSATVVEAMASARE